MVVALLLGCNSSRAPTPIDAPVDVMMEHCTGPTADAGPVDFFGESCMEAPDPAVTVCHNNLGWCVMGVCRPQCAGFGCPRCIAGRELYSNRGACYCAP